MLYHILLSDLLPNKLQTFDKIILYLAHILLYSWLILLF